MFIVLECPGYMEIDKRGAPRGKRSECEREEFEGVSSIVCCYVFAVYLSAVVINACALK